MGMVPPRILRPRRDPVNNPSLQKLVRMQDEGLKKMQDEGWTMQTTIDTIPSDAYLRDFCLSHGDLPWQQEPYCSNDVGEQEMGTPPVPLARSRLNDTQSFDPNRSNYVPPIWGISTREAAEALASIFGRSIAPATPEPIGDSSSGIEPCSYEEL